MSAMDAPHGLARLRALNAPVRVDVQVGPDGNPTRVVLPTRSRRPDQSRRAEQVSRSGRVGQSGRPEQVSQAGRLDQSRRGEQVSRAGRVDQSGRPEQVSRAGRSGQAGSRGRQARTVEAVQERWRIDEGWWSDQPVSRIYWRLVLDNGQLVTVFLDMDDRTWWEQRA